MQKWVESDRVEGIADYVTPEVCLSLHLCLSRVALAYYEEPD